MKALIFLILLTLISCQSNTHSNGWHKIYTNDKDGKAIFGDKDQLIHAVRNGYPVRIGWGGKRVEHVAEAKFLTILEGEVFGQIDKIIGQAPSIKDGFVKMDLRRQNQWTKIAGTNGYTTSLMTDYLNDSIVGGGENMASTTWFVYYPRTTEKLNSKPLWSENSPKWENWNSDN